MTTTPVDAKRQVAKAKVVVAVRGVADKALTLDALEGRLETLEAEMLEVNANSERLSRTHAELAELQVVLEKAGGFFDTARIAAQREDLGRSPSMPEAMDAPLLESAQPVDAKTSRLGFVAGTISMEKLLPFERLLFRATRGNMFLRQAPVGKLRDPASGEHVDKAVFVVFYAGERARAKILKICEAFAANRYPFPEDAARQRQMHAEVTSRLRDLHTTISAGDDHRAGALAGIAVSLEGWTLQARRFVFFARRSREAAGREGGEERACGAMRAALLCKAQHTQAAARRGAHRPPSSPTG